MPHIYREIEQICRVRLNLNTGNNRSDQVKYITKSRLPETEKGLRPSCIIFAALHQSVSTNETPIVGDS